MANKVNIPTQRHLADLLGCSPAMVNGYLKRPDWPFNRHAPWRNSEVPAMMKWRAEVLKATTVPTGDVAELRRQKLQQEVRRITAAAELLESDLAKSRRELIPVDQVKQSWANHITMVRNRFMGLPPAIIPHLEGRTPAEWLGILEQFITDILRSLAES